MTGSIIPYRNPKALQPLPSESPDAGGLKIGEIVAWVVALAAICGVLIMATTVYRTVSASVQPGNNAPSHMDHDYQYGDHYELQLAEFRPQVSFKRKPGKPKTWLLVKSS